jgi:hypothetical protein
LHTEANNLQTIENTPAIGAKRTAYLSSMFVTEFRLSGSEQPACRFRPETAATASVK